ncbi:hypothetical protein [Skermania piniformis]|uniref:Chorismate mutase n=1 Tax=Skermania pinensis TaxID=39122 RepID=A0ABX8S762_9ACTN|nr:hypothetical protein [Skermania piniformis]QXQ13657.1 chorismate mutase [Skermania piniformis]
MTADTGADYPAENDAEYLVEPLLAEVEALDELILAAIRRRTALARQLGRTMIGPGRTVSSRSQQHRELAVLRRFAEFDQEGRTLAMVLLRLGRGRPGPAP